MATDSEKRKKKLVKYLADYIEQEVEEWEQANTDEGVCTITEMELKDWIAEGIDAFESVEDVSIFVMPQIHERSCRTCYKYAAPNCGNDTENLLCWERR